jgi:hypothetical protein
MLAVQPLMDTAMDVAANALRQSRRVRAVVFINADSGQAGGFRLREHCCALGTMSTMKLGALTLLLALLLLGTSWLVMRNNFRGGSPSPPPVETRDAKQDALLQACVAARDREIHRQTFDTIDNPDVQREVLATEKERAIRDCRALFPPL